MIPKCWRVETTSSFLMLVNSQISLKEGEKKIGHWHPSGFPLLQSFNQSINQLLLMWIHYQTWVNTTLGSLTWLLLLEGFHPLHLWVRPEFPKWSVTSNCDMTAILNLTVVSQEFQSFLQTLKVRNLNQKAHCQTVNLYDTAKAKKFQTL